MKKTIKFILRVRSKEQTELPDWGLGRGVLATQEMEYEEGDMEKYGQESFMRTCLDIDSNVEVITEGI